MTPTKGFRFLHSRVLNDRNEPQLYEVSRIARGVVYYRPVHEDGSKGNPDYCAVEDFQKYRKQSA